MSPISLILFRKSFEFSMQDQFPGMIVLRWLSTNPDGFSVGVPQLEINCQPSTLKSFHEIQQESAICLVQFTSSFMIKSKALQLFICFKTSVFKVLKHLVVGFCMGFYQFFIKFNFFANRFITQLLFSFLKAVVSVPKYHARSFARFFITRF